VPATDYLVNTDSLLYPADYTNISAVLMWAGLKMWPAAWEGPEKQCWFRWSLIHATSMFGLLLLALLVSERVTSCSSYNGHIQLVASRFEESLRSARNIVTKVSISCGIFRFQSKFCRTLHDAQWIR